MHQINDLTITRGHETPQKYLLFYTERFFDRLNSKQNLLPVCGNHYM